MQQGQLKGKQEIARNLLAYVNFLDKVFTKVTGLKKSLVDNI